MTRTTRTALLSAVLTAVAHGFAVCGACPTADDLKNDEKTPDNVLVYGMGYSGDRYSPLTQINKDNVSKLVPVWSYSLADLQGGEGFPIVNDGVIYVTTHDSTQPSTPLPASRSGGSNTTIRRRRCASSAAASSIAAPRSTRA